MLSSATNDFHLANGPHDISKFRVLTADVIEQLCHDIKSTYLPSWIERPPTNFGSAAHGKLKADHWWTVCTISMVITLVRVWGSASASIAEHQLLDNFIHLVIAVDLATRRSVNPERARLFDYHMEEYLHTLRTLFAHDLIPNHHLSLHLATCLLSFGPVHGWWAYPFECFNGIIQRLNTNNQTGMFVTAQPLVQVYSSQPADKIPLTYMRTFHAAAELRWRMSSTEWPSDKSIQDVLSAFNTVYRDAAHGTRIVDVLGATPGNGSQAVLKALYASHHDSRLDETVYNAMVRLMNSAHPASRFTAFTQSLNNCVPLSPLARFVPKVELSRFTYGTRESNIRNSFVCFRDPLSVEPSLIRAGQISQIFLHSYFDPQTNEQSLKPYFVISQYTELAEAHACRDPYRLFPLLGTRLCYNRIQASRAVVGSTDIVSHFAALVYVPEGIGETCIVVRSLDQVRFFTSIPQDIPLTHSFRSKPGNKEGFMCRL